MLSTQDELKTNLPSGEAGSKPESDSELNRKLADTSLTILKGTEEDIKGFMNTGFCTYTVKRSIENQDSKEILDSLKVVVSEVEKEENILLLLTPPKVKPANNFGLFKEEIDFINELIETKNVVLYLFGNPYFLNHLQIEKAIAVVVAYQEFTEFQDAAAAHFTGKSIAQGKLPVTV